MEYIFCMEIKNGFDIKTEIHQLEEGGYWAPELVQ